MDLTPLRTSRDLRLLVGAGTVIYLGGMASNVALAYQLYHLTGSNLSVGLMGAVELVPLVVFGLYGGAIADHHDRRTVLVLTGAAQAVLTGLLWLNSALPSPQVWAIYVLAALLSAAQSLHRPSREALIPRVVAHDQLLAASAVSSLGWQVGMLAGPAIGGVLVAQAGVPWAMALDTTGLTLATLVLTRLAPAPPLGESEAPGIASILEGVRYATSRPDLVGTYVIDLVAMIMAMPETVFPALATDVFHHPELLGLLYTAGTVGSFLATLSSGWTRRIHRHGRAVIAAAALWGAAIAAAGASTSIWLALAFLVLAGAADMISALFRQTIWNQTIPDERRGRLAGIEMLSYSIGPLGGQVRAGLVADAFGVRRSIVSGGLLCVAGVLITAAWLPRFRGYDTRTDRYALHERAVRAARAGAAQQD